MARSKTPMADEEKVSKFKIVRAWMRLKLRSMFQFLNLARIQMRDAEMPILVGSLAFSTVLSLVPLLAVSLSVFTAYGGFESLLLKFEPFIMQNFVDASGAELSRWVRRSIQRVHSGALGLGGVIGLLFASTKLFYDIEYAVHRVWHLKSERAIWKRLLIYWMVMFFVPLLVAIVLGLLGSRDLSSLSWLPKRTTTLVLSLIAFTLIYKYIPSVIVRWKSALHASVFATIGVALAQEFHAVVVKQILNFNKIYGSLASLPIFLLWLFVLWWIGLTGVAFCAVLERKQHLKEEVA